MEFKYESFGFNQGRNCRITQKTLCLSTGPAECVILFSSIPYALRFYSSPRSHSILHELYSVDDCLARLNIKLNFSLAKILLCWAGGGT